MDRLGRALQRDFGFPPVLPPTTAQATEPVGPAEPKEVFPAGPLRQEARLKVQRFPRIILHRRSYYSFVPTGVNYIPMFRKIFVRRRQGPKKALWVLLAEIAL